MEFLGDAVLKLTCSWYLYEKHPDLAEGELSAIVGQVVSEKSLAAAATRVGLSRFLLVGPSLEATGGRELPSVLADSLEAIIGAVFLDQGLKAAKDFVVRRLMLDTLDTQEYLKETNLRNYKAELQEFFQKTRKTLPEYRVVSERGPDHDKTLLFLCIQGGRNRLRGWKDEKQAEQAAAEEH